MKKKQILRVFSTSFLLGALLVTSPTFADTQAKSTIKNEVVKNEVKEKIEDKAIMNNSYKSKLKIIGFEGFGWSDWFVENYEFAKDYKDDNSYIELGLDEVYRYSYDKDSKNEDVVTFRTQLIKDGKDNKQKTKANDLIKKYNELAKTKKAYDVKTSFKDLKEINFVISEQFKKPIIDGSDVYLNKKQFLKDFSAIRGNVLDIYNEKHNSKFDKLVSVYPVEAHDKKTKITLPDNIPEEFRSKSTQGFAMQSLYLSSSIFKENESLKAYSITNGLFGSHDFIYRPEKAESLDDSFVVFSKDYNYKADPSLKFKEVKKADARHIVGYREFLGTTDKTDLKDFTKNFSKVFGMDEKVGGYNLIGNVEKKTEKVEFKTVEEKDETLEKGKTKVKVDGVLGEVEKTIVYEVNPKTGELINPKSEEKVIKSPVDRIVLVGTKEVKADNKTDSKKDNKDSEVNSKKDTTKDKNTKTNNGSEKVELVNDFTVTEKTEKNVKKDAKTNAKKDPKKLKTNKNGVIINEDGIVAEGLKYQKPEKESVKKGSKTSKDFTANEKQIEQAKKSGSNKLPKAGANAELGILIAGGLTVGAGAYVLNRKKKDEK